MTHVNKIKTLKIVVLACIISFMPLNGNAQNHSRFPMPCIIVPMESTTEVFNNIVDSIMRTIEEDTSYVFMLDINVLAGHLCDRYIHRDKNVKEESIEFCVFGNQYHLDSYFLRILMNKMRLYNDTHDLKLSVRGFDATTIPVSWISYLYDVPEYRETTIIDSLTRYCLDESLDDIYSQAKRTVKMMDKNNKIKKILGSEYSDWHRYVHGLTQYKDYDDSNRSLYNDYNWFSRHTKEKKILICTDFFVSVINYNKCCKILDRAKCKTSGEEILMAVSDNKGRATGIVDNFHKGLDYIDKELKSNHPVMVVVDYKDGHIMEWQHTDKGGDSFVVIVNGDRKSGYHFYDPTNEKDAEVNKFVFDKGFLKSENHTERGALSYVLTSVRLNR